MSFILMPYSDPELHMPSKHNTKKTSDNKASGHTPDKKSMEKEASTWANDTVAKMEACHTAESLNDQVIAPFIKALVSVCDARGYVFNIYGNHCNIAITPETHSESLYRLIDAYMDEANL